MTRMRVLLLYGGRSAEHDVSCTSAFRVAAAMDKERYEVVAVGITREGRWLRHPGPLPGGDGAERLLVLGEAVSLVLDPVASGLSGVGRIDACFPVLHGPMGEDGTVQGLLELAGIPYVGSGVLGSSMGMDKEKMKIAFAAYGLPIGRYEVVRASEWEEAPDPEGLGGRIGFPCFVKPANLGSSVGISRCASVPGLAEGIALALEFDRKVIVEEAIPGREIECALLGNDHPQASACGEILPGRDFYDYQAKYEDAASRTVVPADIPAGISERIRSWSVKAFRAVDAAGMARVDFFYDQDAPGGPHGKVVVNEINTIPGFTPISMFPQLWAEGGLSYPALIDRLIELGLERHAMRAAIRTAP